MTKGISRQAKPVAALIAAGHFLPIGVSTGSIAPMPVMSRSGFKAVVPVRKDQYCADMLYHMSLSVAKAMREKGLITADEYDEIDTVLLAKYQPYLGRLISENA